MSKSRSRELPVGPRLPNPVRIDALHAGPSDPAEIGVDLDLRAGGAMRQQRMIADRRRIARPLPYPSICARPARASRPGARACRLPSQDGRLAPADRPKTPIMKIA
jgi:hypothetical protein